VGTYEAWLGCGLDVIADPPDLANREPCTVDRIEGPALVWQVVLTPAHEFLDAPAIEFDAAPVTFAIFGVAVCCCPQLTLIRSIVPSWL
jgi:hypothetical protein